MGTRHAKHAEHDHAEHEHAEHAHDEPTEFLQKHNHSLKNLTRHARHAEHDHAEHDEAEQDDEEAEDMPAHAGVPLEQREKPTRRIAKPEPTEFAQKASKSFLRRH